MAFIEIGVGHFLAGLVVHAGDAEAVERVTDQPIVRGGLTKAWARPVIVILARPLRVAVAVVLHFVRNRIAPCGIQGVEECNAAGCHPDHSHRHAGWRGSKGGESGKENAICCAVILFGLRSDR
jgi:hypothetical protein